MASNRKPSHRVNGDTIVFSHYRCRVCAKHSIDANLTDDYVARTALTFLSSLDPESQIVEEKKLVASIAADGRMEINRHPVDLANFEAVLRREKENTRSLTLVVRTDKETKHRHVLDLFEVAKRVGIEKIPLATDEVTD